MLKLSELVREGAAVAGLRATGRDDVVRELGDALVASGAVPASLRDELVARVLKRETYSSTGFGRGVAVPHAKHPDLRSMAAAVGISQRGIDFASLDKQPVFVVVMLVSPQDAPEDHLKAMEVIFKHLSKESFRRTLRQASDAAGIRQVLLDADAAQLTV